MNDILLIKTIEKYDWNVLEMAREIQKNENMIEQLAEKLQEDKKEKRELREEIKNLEQEEQDEIISSDKFTVGKRETGEQPDDN